MKATVTIQAKDISGEHCRSALGPLRRFRFMLIPVQRRASKRFSMFLRFAFFWLLEMTLGYLWAALSGLFLNFFSGGNGPSALFVVMGLSGFVQGLLLCFALIAAAVPWLKPLAVLVLLFTLVLRLVFVVRNAARAAQVGAGKAFGALCFALVSVAAGVFLCAGAAGLFIAFLF